MEKNDDDLDYEITSIRWFIYRLMPCLFQSICNWFKCSMCQHITPEIDIFHRHRQWPTAPRGVLTKFRMLHSELGHHSPASNINWCVESASHREMTEMWVKEAQNIRNATEKGITIHQTPNRQQYQVGHVTKLSIMGCDVNLQMTFALKGIRFTT